MIERRKHHEPAGRDEEDGGERMPGCAVMLRDIHVTAKDEERKTSEAEEDEIDRDDVVQDLLILSGDCNNRRQHALQDDSGDRDACISREPREGAKKELVASHCEINARSGQHTLAQEP